MKKKYLKKHTQKYIYDLPIHSYSRTSIFIYFQRVKEKTTAAVVYVCPLNSVDNVCYFMLVKPQSTRERAREYTGITGTLNIVKIRNVQWTDYSFENHW